MATQVQNVNKTNAGLCPHGLPPSACPICSKMAGGGGMRAGERPQKTGEMSYHQCVMLGNLMRARELAEKRHLQNLENKIEVLKAFENLMNKAVINLKDFILNANAHFITKPIAFVAQVLVLPVLTLIQNIPKLIKNIQSFKFDIQDKLNAIFGEMKNFVQKKLSEIVSVMKTSFEKLFKIFKKHNAEDDDTKIDDDKKIFNLKNIIRKIIRKKKEKDDDNSQDK